MSSYKPDGIPAIVPYIFLSGIAEFVEFAEKGLGAEVMQRTAGDDGNLFYATLQFADGTVFVQEADDTSADTKLTNSGIYLYVEDVDRAYKKALDAGAESIAEPQEFYHGDKNAVVKDKWGNRWWLGFNQVDHLTDDEVAERRKQED